jgi:hypothetical protein
MIVSGGVATAPEALCVQKLPSVRVGVGAKSCHHEVPARAWVLSKQVHWTRWEELSPHCRRTKAHNSQQPQVMVSMHVADPHALEANQPLLECIAAITP